MTGPEDPDILRINVLARLGAEKMPGKEVHVFCAAYRDDEFDALLTYADHIVFNSPGQLKKFGPKAKQHGKSIGLLDGLHFHTLCEQNSDALKMTLNAVEEKLGDILPKVKWLNMGGGHHITREDYDVALLEQLILDVQKKWDVEVYLEPGEAVALNAGFLASRVLDIVKNGTTRIALLDVSAACHMPDVIEMPYMPPLYGATECKEGNFTYLLAGPTCLAGDVIGRYNFEEELHIGDLLLFGDLAIYSTCKNNTFNGMPLPNIYRRTFDGNFERLTDFGYEDFKMRLGR